MTVATGAYGLACAVLSALFSGSWSAIVKAPALRRTKCHAAILNCYFMLGFWALSLVAAAAATRALAFTPYGLASGALLVAASAGTLSVTIPILGVAVASAASNSAVVRPDRSAMTSLVLVEYEAMT